MKIQRKKSFFTRTRILIIAAIVILAVGGAAFWWFFMRGQSNTQNASNDVNYGPATEQEKQDSADAKQRAVDESETPEPTEPTTPTSDTLIVTINRAGQTGPGQAVAVRTQIDGASSGTCDLTFTKNGATITKTFTITTEATVTTCNGDVDASEFATTGEWDLSVVAKSSGVASKPATQKVTVQK